VKFVRSYHWLITGLLFLIAIAFYLTGFGIGAAVLVFLGLLFETAAWLSFAMHPSKASSGSDKR
jgi:hypothetical protein